MLKQKAIETLSDNNQTLITKEKRLLFKHSSMAPFKNEVTGSLIGSALALCFLLSNKATMEENRYHQDIKQEIPDTLYPKDRYLDPCGHILTDQYQQK